MNLQCGHKADCDLDTICPECGRSFLTRPYIPYLFISGILLVIYYLRPYSFKDLISPVFWIVSWFVLTIILRKRPNELSKALMLIIPTMLIWAITRENPPHYFIGIDRILFIASIILISIPIVGSISLGFQDAVHMSKLNKGSYWIVLSVFISLGLTLLYYSFPTIIDLIPFPDIRDVLDNVYYYLEIIYKYRSALVAIVLGLVTVISISVSLIKELKVKSFNIPNTQSQSNASPFSVIVKSIENLSIIFLGAIRTAGDLVRQILVIIFEEVFALIRDTFMRTVLIILRLVRTTIIIILSIFLYNSIDNIVDLIQMLWNSESFWTTSFTGWFFFLINCIVFFVIIWLMSMITYRKWKEFNGQSFSLSRAFASFFGSKREVLIAYRSITISTIMHLFFFTLAFLATWLIINPVHYLFNLKYPEPLGFLFAFSIGLIILFGIIKLIFNKAIQKK